MSLADQLKPGDTVYVAGGFFGNLQRETVINISNKRKDIRLKGCKLVFDKHGVEKDIGFHRILLPSGSVESDYRKHELSREALAICDALRKELFCDKRISTDKLETWIALTQEIIKDLEATK